MERNLAGTPCFLGILLLIWFQFCMVDVVHSRSIRNMTEFRNNRSRHNEVHKIKVAKFDFEYIATPFIVTVWVLLASLLKVVFHMTERLSKVFPESCMVILLGVLLGWILKVSGFQNVATIQFFNSRIFFLFLLPPIVLDAGYFLHTRAFFDNIGTILLYAVVGTIFNTFTVGLTLYATTDLGINLLQMLLFSCLIAAVDPVAVLAVFEEVHVNEVLYILVFGESLLNDAVTVVLYRLFEALVSQPSVSVEEVFIGVAAFFVVSIGGMIIGVFWAFLTAFLTKFTDHVRVLEPIFVVCMCYMSYLTAELFHFSGIISIVTCAIVMKSYVEANISQKSRIPMKYFMKMASGLSDTIIFMMLGVVLFEHELEFHASFVFLTIFFIFVYRCVGVVLLTWLANKLRLNKLGKVDQFIMAYGGLRGAVSFSLATVLDDENVADKKEILITTTIAVVFFTVFVQGITIKPLVNLLKVKRSVKRKEVMLGEVNDKMLDHLLGGVQDVIQHRGRYYWKNLYQYVDLKYLRPWFMRNRSDQQAIDETVLMVYRKISSREVGPPEYKRETSDPNEEPDEFEHVVKDRRRSSGVSQPEECEGFKNVVQHVQLAMLLAKPQKGTRRFSKNNIAEESDICEEALRLRRRSQAQQMPRSVISRKVSREQQRDLEESGTHEQNVSTHHKRHHRKPHHKHRKHGRHHGKHQKVCKQLSDIPESPSSDHPPGADTPSGRYSPSGPDARGDNADGSDHDMKSASDAEREDLLPKLADLEPSSPRLDMNFGGLSEPSVSTQGSFSAAAEDGVDETVM
ncbi:probable Na(+)/H(+) antiporter nhx-9 [Dendronephthya gigantea]|uniref:probable Na(+)/H(+) antiporter nhx-9 n=1 Tax=Dendronephthya gigantea TaxID=151771 RepID=UPI001069947F|nr:probable Na(+)/H(+) antiporter nhx-9 [Dendronephthya gigantea]